MIKQVDETNAAEYVETAARGTIKTMGRLIRLAERRGGVGAEVAESLLGMDIVSGETTAEEVEEAATEAIETWPLCVEATTTFEVVLGTGGPDTRLCFECDRATVGENCAGPDLFDYEIRRVFYRYSWSGSATVDLHGDDRETAEAFARRVVPELSDF